MLDATTKKRKQFQFVVESHANLSLVHIHGWAGLGAVRLGLIFKIYLDV